MHLSRFESNAWCLFLQPTEPEDYLAYLVQNDLLVDCLYTISKTYDNVSIQHDTSVTHYDVRDSKTTSTDDSRLVHMTLSSGDMISARLVVCYYLTEVNIIWCLFHQFVIKFFHGQLYGSYLI